MKKVILAAVTGIFLVSAGYAFVYEIPILSPQEIAKLSDDALIEKYIDVIVEVDAAKSFHQTSGFRPQDYQKHKDILKYKIYLQMEIQKRKLDVPLEEPASKGAKANE